VKLGLIVLRGVGQVMFQGHAATGLFFLAGIAYGSPLMAAGALTGAIVGPAVAYLLKFDRDEIEQGIYGFNPTLVGIALLFYLKLAPMTWVLLLAGCVTATLITYLARRFLKFPTYTGPFIVATWAMLMLAHSMAGRSIDLIPASPPRMPSGFIESVLAGEAEVMFGANSWTGFLFLVGIALSNWRHAVIALLGSVVGTLFAYYHHDPESTISIGIYGYNSALAAMAIYLWRESLNLAILAALVALPLTEFFPATPSIPPLTAPFVAAAWVVLAIGAAEGYFRKK
jgi:urea transporter